jgi:hypothetical protein
MLKVSFFTLAVIALFILVAPVTEGQTQESKFEGGGQFSSLQLDIRSATSTGTFTISKDRQNISGFGGRFGYNLTRSVALEAEVNFFPQNRDLEGGRKVQGLFGIKAGKRLERIGLFARGRPGFIRFGKGDYFFAHGCAQIFPPPLGCFDPVARTSFAIDLGGVVELYPSPRIIVRFDAGDTIVRLPARTVAASDPTFGPPGYLVAIPVNAETRHNFQGSVGFGFRF